MKGWSGRLGSPVQRGTEARAVGSEAVGVAGGDGDGGGGGGGRGGGGGGGGGGGDEKGGGGGMIGGEGAVEGGGGGRFGGGGGGGGGLVGGGGGGGDGGGGGGELGRGGGLGNGGGGGGESHVARFSPISRGLLTGSHDFSPSRPMTAWKPSPHPKHIAEAPVTSRTVQPGHSHLLPKGLDTRVVPP